MVAMMRASGKMAVMEYDHVAEQARRRALVRRGYHAISLAYRSNDGDAAASSAEDVSRYAGWVAELAGLLRPGTGTRPCCPCKSGCSDPTTPTP